MSQFPTYKQKPVDTRVQYGAASAGTVMQVANATERLSGRLSSVTQAVTQLAQPIIKEETIVTALDDVKEGKIDSNNVALVAKDVYKKTANAALVADIEVSGKKLGLGLLRSQQASGRYNANSFNGSWAAYTKSTLAGIADRDIKENIENRLAKQGLQFSSQIASMQVKQQRTRQTNNLKGKLAMDVDSLNASFGVNSEETLRLQGEIDSTLMTMVSSNLLAPNMAMLQRKKIYKGAYMTGLQRELTTAINAGEATEFYSAFKNKDHYGLMSPKDVETFRSSIRAQLAVDVGIYNQDLQAQETEFKMRELETTNEFNDAWLQGDLSPLDVNYALQTGSIDLATHKTYMDKAQEKDKIVDSEDKLLFFRSHVLDVTEEEIQNSVYFTNNTKWDLIKQRRSEKSDADNWRTSPNGIEARQRIGDMFGFFKGTMFAKFDTELGKEYNDTYDDFYAEVEALPFAQRANKALTIAKKHMKEYSTQKETKKIEQKRKSIERRKEAEERAAGTYKDKTVGTFVNMKQENAWDKLKRAWEDMD